MTETTTEAAPAASPTRSRLKKRLPSTARAGTTKVGVTTRTGATKAGKSKTPWQILLLPVERIDANPYQPRLSFDPLEMADLVASVREHGVQQPIIVRTLPLEPEKAKRKVDQEAMSASNGHAATNSKSAVQGSSSSNGQCVRTHSNAVRYQLVTGERRLRACREANRRFVPAILRDDLGDVQVAELALLENVQRSNLTVIEEAKGYKRLMIEFRLKEERIARKVGKSLQTIKDTLKLLALPEEAQQLLSEKKLTASHGHALLDLTPFPEVCTLVAKHAAQTPLTATSLVATPLPNAELLKQKRLVVELDRRTRFNWTSECADCPHHAYLRSGHSFFCLQPEEWKKKQTLAIERNKQEAAQVLEEAKKQGQSTVETGKLKPASYRDLRYLTLPAGCSASCACRGEAVDPTDPTKRIPLCLDPNRLHELREAEQQAQGDKRQRRASALWSEAKAVLEAETSQGKIESGEASKVAALLAWPVLQGRRMRFAGEPEEWEQIARQVGTDLGLSLTWDELFDADTEAAQELALLQALEPVQLFLLAACLLLAQEAAQMIHCESEAPGLGFVLGHDRVRQLELEVGATDENKGEEEKDDDHDEESFMREGLEEASAEDEESNEGGNDDSLEPDFDDETEAAAEEENGEAAFSVSDFEPEGYKRSDPTDEREYSPDETTEESADAEQPVSQGEESEEREEHQTQQELVTAG